MIEGAECYGISRAASWPVGGFTDGCPSPNVRPSLVGDKANTPSAGDWHGMERQR